MDLLAGVFLLYCRLAVIWADSAYGGLFVKRAKGLRPYGKLHLEVVDKAPDQKGFCVLRKRWIVERTFAWGEMKTPALRLREKNLEL